MYNIRFIFFVVAIAFTSNITAQTIYTTKTGKKYHTSNCRYLKYSKKEITLKKALSLGYQACSVCKPTANKTKTIKSSSSSALSSNNKSSSSTKRTTAIQCSGKTKSGARCKRQTKNASGRCYQH